MRRTVVVNFAMIQIGWFVAVLGAARGLPWPGPALAIVVIAWYLAISRQRGRELFFVVASALVGFAVDSSLVQLDLVRFAASWPSDAVGPAWTLGLWAQLATAFTRSMGWLIGRPVLAALLAPVAPLTYWAGARLGAAEFPDGLPLALVAIGIAWVIALPLLALLSARVLVDPGAASRALGHRPKPDSPHGEAIP